MAPILKVSSKWTGFSGAPGYSNFFFQNNFGTAPSTDERQKAIAATDSFWMAVLPLLPNTVTITVQSDVEVIEETTGMLIDVMSGPALTSRVGTGGVGAYSGASGAVLTWRTNGVRNGRRVRGRTFLVPLAIGAYQNDGTLADTARTTLGTAANSLITPAAGTPPFNVWARPSAKGASDGNSYEVVGSSVPDMAAVLRSRRAS